MLFDFLPGPMKYHTYQFNYNANSGALVPIYVLLCMYAMCKY